MVASTLRNRNITTDKGRTSMRLEPELWQALRDICAREGVALRDLIGQIESEAAGGRTSQVRVFVIDYFRAAATEAGHWAAGHGRKDLPLASQQSGFVTGSATIPA